jgi:hypothetical protein
LAGRDKAAMDTLVEVGLGRGTLPPRLLLRLLRRAFTLVVAHGARRLLHLAGAKVRLTGGRFAGSKRSPFSYVRRRFCRPR